MGVCPDAIPWYADSGEIIPQTGQRVPDCWYLLPPDILDGPEGSNGWYAEDIIHILSDIDELGLTNPRMIVASKCYDHLNKASIVQTDEMFLRWGDFNGEFDVITKPDNLYDIIEALYGSTYFERLNMDEVDPYLVRATKKRLRAEAAEMEANGSAELIDLFNMTRLVAEADSEPPVDEGNEILFGYDRSHEGACPDFRTRYAISGEVVPQTGQRVPHCWSLVPPDALDRPVESAFWNTERVKDIKKDLEYHTLTNPRPIMFSDCLAHKVQAMIIVTAEANLWVRLPCGGMEVIRWPRNLYDIVSKLTNKDPGKCVFTEWASFHQDPVTGTLLGEKCEVTLRGAE